MEPASIYISETNIEKENKFTLNFCEETDVKYILFSPDKEYYITSMSCNLQITSHETYSTNDKSVHDDIKKLSEMSRNLLDKGVTYQNDIKKVIIKIGVNGATEVINRDLEFYLTDELINAFSYKYKFFDVEENRV